jgi:hypothetical protein
MAMFGLLYLHKDASSSRFVSDGRDVREVLRLLIAIR